MDTIQMNMSNLVLSERNKENNEVLYGIIKDIKKNMTRKGLHELYCPYS